MTIYYIIYNYLYINTYQVHRVYCVYYIYMYITFYVCIPTNVVDDFQHPGQPGTGEPGQEDTGWQTLTHLTLHSCRTPDTRLFSYQNIPEFLKGLSCLCVWYSHICWCCRNIFEYSWHYVIHLPMLHRLFKAYSEWFVFITYFIIRVPQMQSGWRFTHLVNR